MKQAMTIDTLWASLGASLAADADKGYRSYATEADALADDYRGKKYVGVSPDDWNDTDGPGNV